MKRARDIEAEICELYQHLLQRQPAEAELSRWVTRAWTNSLSFKDLFDQFIRSDEYGKRTRVIPGHPVGHYYSPVVDTESLHSHFAPNRKPPIEDLFGLSVTESDIRATFDAMKPYIGARRFAHEKIDGERYYIDNDFFPLGDAIILSAMIMWKQPSKIIEIGSGFSTACMLDTIELSSPDTTITCIEPYPQRLRSRLLPSDLPRMTIIEDPVQKVDPAMFESLGLGDILFIDSTHVLKTGSDVCFELFEILPRLRPGVLIYFHDIHYPFEYSESWIFQKRFSWNEIYAVRAFLMYNRKYRIIYFNNYFGNIFRRELEAAYGAPVPNAGGSLWLRVGE